MNYQRNGNKKDTIWGNEKNPKIDSRKRRN